VSVLHLGDPVLAALSWLPRLFRVPVAVTVHGLDISFPSLVYQAYLRLCFWGRMQAYICISRHVRDRVLAAGMPAGQVLVIPVGVGELAAIAPEPELEARLASSSPVLLSLGRLVERKGLHWFLREVAPDFFRQHPNASLVIAGDGPMRAAIEAAVEASGLTPHVLLLGAVSESRKAWLLQRCDLVVMPNIPVDGDAEGFGLVALEAGSAGRWVLVSDMEGLRDAVTEDCNGERVPAGDALAWSAALDRTCADRSELRMHGEHARDYVRAQFSWSAMAQRYERLFKVLEADAV
jgi:phosphatidylinositol alpha-1,6-mannosyltransferase